MYDQGTVGARLRVLRRWRGLTLTELAGLAGLSTSYLSMAERGLRPIDRRSVIGRLAAALKVSESDLVGGPHLSADPVQSDPHLCVPSLRAALQTNNLDEPSAERARPLAELLAELERIEPFHQACDYLTVGKVLPELLDELHVHVATPRDEAAERAALQGLVQASVIATFVAKDLGYNDLGYIAATRAAQAADRLDDPVMKAMASFVLIHTAPRAGTWDRTLRMAERAADDLEPHTVEPLGIHVCGMLTLSAALAGAVLQRGDVAQHWMGQAEELAARVPDTPDDTWMSFSTTNVNVWKVAVAVERGESGGAVLDLARHVDPEKLSGKKGRLASYMADVGRGLAREPKTRHQAIGWLKQAEQTAPQWIRNSAPVRETVAYLLGRAIAEAGGRELRGMAARMGVPH